jgi:hypothetical protein
MGVRSTAQAMRNNFFFDNVLSNRVEMLSKTNELSLPKINKSFELTKIIET